MFVFHSYFRLRHRCARALGVANGRSWQLIVRVQPNQVSWSCAAYKTHIQTQTLSLLSESFLLDSVNDARRARLWFIRIRQRVTLLITAWWHVCVYLRALTEMLCRDVRVYNVSTFPKNGSSGFHGLSLSVSVSVSRDVDLIIESLRPESTSNNSVME